MVRLLTVAQSSSPTPEPFAARASGTFAHDTMILARWGRQDEALDLLREREAILPLTSPFAEDRP